MSSGRLLVQQLAYRIRSAAAVRLGRGSEQGLYLVRFKRQRRIEVLACHIAGH